MQIIKLTPDLAKCSLIRLAFTKLSKENSFTFTYNQVSYAFIRNYNQPQRLRYDLVITKGKKRKKFENISRKEIMAIYFRKDKLAAIKKIPNVPEGVVFWQIEG